MSKLTIDDLAKAQQQTDANIDGIVRLLENREESKTANIASGLVSLIVFAFGVFLAFNGNLAGICVCMIAISARIERLLAKR